MSGCCYDPPRLERVRHSAPVPRPRRVVCTEDVRADAPVSRGGQEWTGKGVVSTTGSSVVSTGRGRVIDGSAGDGDGCGRSCKVSEGTEVSRVLDSAKC